MIIEFTVFNVKYMDTINEMKMLQNDDYFTTFNEDALLILKNDGSLILECLFVNAKDNKNYEIILLLWMINKHYNQIVTHEFKLQTLSLYNNLDQLIDVNIDDSLSFDITTHLQECNYHLLYILYIKSGDGCNINDVYKYYDGNCNECHIIGSVVEHCTENQYVCRCCGHVTVISWMSDDEDWRYKSALVTNDDSSDDRDNGPTSWWK